MAFFSMTLDCFVPSRPSVKRRRLLEGTDGHTEEPEQLVHQLVAVLRAHELAVVEEPRDEVVEAPAEVGDDGPREESLEERSGRGSELEAVALERKWWLGHPFRCQALQC